MGLAPCSSVLSAARRPACVLVCVLMYLCCLIWVVQVLQGLETYITTEKFLHTLEAASAEWIDLSDHQQHPHKGWSPPSSSSELELQQVCDGQLCLACFVTRTQEEYSTSTACLSCVTAAATQLA